LMSCSIWLAQHGRIIDWPRGGQKLIFHSRPTAGPILTRKPGSRYRASQFHLCAGGGRHPCGHGARAGRCGGQVSGTPPAGRELSTCRAERPLHQSGLFPRSMPVRQVLSLGRALARSTETGGRDLPPRTRRTAAKPLETLERVKGIEPSSSAWKGVFLGADRGAACRCSP
jgi:hypothetical protein